MTYLVACVVSLSSSVVAVELFSVLPKKIGCSR